MSRFTGRQLKGNKFINSERQDLHAVIHWLKAQYPNVIYHFDYGADAKLEPRQAKERKDLSWGRGWPDILIFEPRGGYCGLALDLKREDAKFFKGNGMFLNEHVKEQVNCMEKLACRGWKWHMPKGFDEANRIISEYLSLK